VTEQIIDLNEVWGERFYPLLKVESRYLVMSGGRGSGKSEFAARKILRRCVDEGGHRFLVLRKVRARCRESVVEVFRRLLIGHGIPFEEAKTDRTLRFLGNEILFDGLDDPQKIKSFAGVTGIWIEEATEFSEPDFLGVDLILREPTPFYKQIILTFNPEEALAPWLKKRFFDAVDPDATVHTSTIDDNPIKAVRDTYRARLDLIQDKTARDIYRFGLWAMAKGIIFNWDVVPAPGVCSDGSKVEAFDAVFYGGDFGYTVDPAALIKIYRKAREYWLEEIVYQTGLTNQDMAAKMKADPRVDVRLASYWDSAEPKSIEEIHREDINAKGAGKGPGSVRSGIDFMRGCTIHVVAGSENIIDEKRVYRYKTDKNGESTPEPVDYKDHAMSAARYGITEEAGGAGGAVFASSSGEVC
jgi:phage terminase large subunit